MSAPYAAIRERLLYQSFNWQGAVLELQAWSAGNFDETHIRTSDLTTAGGVLQSRSGVNFAPPWIVPGGYAASDRMILPGNLFQVGQQISFLTLSDRAGGNDADPLLVLFIDDAEGLPFIANGIDYVVTPDWLQFRGWWRP